MQPATPNSSPAEPEIVASEALPNVVQPEIASTMPTPTQNPILRRMGNLFVKAGKRGFWPLADQGVVSLGNIFTVFLVGQGLAVKSDFANYNQIMEIVLFFLSMHNALITYPLTIKGAIVDDKQLSRLCAIALILTVFFAIPLMALGSAGGAMFGLLAPVSVAAGSLLMWQLQETVRRGMMSHFRHRDAIWGDAISYLGQAAVLWILVHFGKLTLVTAFLSIGLTSTLALLVQAAQVGLARITRSELRAAAADFWHAGKWVASTNFGALGLIVCGSWPLRYRWGGDDTASFFAVAAMLKICNPIMQSVGQLMVPSAAKALHRDGMKAAFSISVKMTLVVAAGLAPFMLLLMMFPGTSLRIAFHGNYSGARAEYALRLFTISYIPVFLVTMATSFLSGVHRARYTFYGQVVGTICMVVILLPMNLLIPITGFVWGGIIQFTIQLGVLGYYIRRTLKEPDDRKVMNAE